MKTSQLTNIDVRALQRQGEASARAIQSQGHRCLRLSVGMCSLAVGSLRSLIGDAGGLIDDVEKRGERLKEDIESRFDSLEQRSAWGVERWQERLQLPADEVTQDSFQGSQVAQEELEIKVEKVLAKLGIPSREQLDKLSKQIEALNAKIDEELVREELLQDMPPFSGYDELNAEMLIARLQDLDAATLNRVSEYEGAHKNRITVEREVDRLLIGKAEQEAA